MPRAGIGVHKHMYQPFKGETESENNHSHAITEPANFDKWYTASTLQHIHRMPSVLMSAPIQYETGPVILNEDTITL